MSKLGILGLSPDYPDYPGYPQSPAKSPKKATPFNNTHHPKRETLISCQKGSDATLGKKNADRLY